MADTTEIRFGDYQLEKRYKKLERALKLATLKKESIEEGDELLPFPTSSDVSSINADTFDFNINIPSLQTSRRANEVTSSSNMLRNILMEKGGVTGVHRTIATSSIKKLDDEYYLMPSSNFDKILHSPIKSNNSTSDRTIKVIPVPQSECSLINNNHKYKPSDIEKGNNDSSNYLQTNFDNVQQRIPKVFIKWKVMLKEEGQLIIKGTLECGIVARSKPISKRLNTTIVESVYKHLYYLKGTIHDNRCVLPDYVRGKFYNGFPDDWENVCQLWRRFMQEGCKPTYRWPTRITDSDDDFMAEVTDVTVLGIASSNDETLHSKSFNELPTRGTPKKDEQDKYTQTLNGTGKRDSFTQTVISNSNRKLFRNVNIQTSLDNFSNNKENRKRQENVDNSCSFNEKNAYALKDKLNIILNNLTDKNCSKEFINKIIEIFDCLNYVVSQRLVNSDNCKLEYTKSEREVSCDIKNKLQCQYKLLPLQYDLEKNKYRHANETKNDKNQFSVATKDDIDISRGTKRSFKEMNEEKCKDGSDSESEMYAGIPKISIDRVLRAKDTLIKGRKRKIKKVIKNKLPKMEHSSDISLIEDYIEVPNIKNISNENYNIDSVSVTERESEAETDFNNRSTINKHPNSVTLKQEHFVHISRDKNVDEMQEHFATEACTSLRRTTRNLDNFLDEARSRKCKSDIKKESRTTPRKELRHVEKMKEWQGRTKNDLHGNYTPYRCPKELQSHSENINNSNASQTFVTSSLPVSMESTFILQQSNANSTNHKKRNKEKVKSNEKRKTVGLIQNAVSPTKRSSHTFANISKTLSINNKKDYDEQTRIQLNSIDSTYSTGSTEIRKETSENNEYDRKAKRLTGWTPNVICNSKLQLVFEGQLLNDSGYVVCRRFKTDPILHRISSHLIETIHHERYELVGDLNDSKHVVPKELLPNCRYGCPLRIEQFCQRWNLLCNGQNINAKSCRKYLIVGAKYSNDKGEHDISSRGRRLLRPLCYWTGERSAVKYDKSVRGPAVEQDIPFLKFSNKSLNENKRANNTKRGSNSKLREPLETFTVTGTKHNSEYNCDTTALRHKLTSLSGNKNIILTSPTKMMSSNQKRSTADEPKTQRYNMDSDLVCAYYKDISAESDMLSDDQVSHV